MIKYCTVSLCIVCRDYSASTSESDSATLSRRVRCQGPSEAPLELHEHQSRISEGITQSYLDFPPALVICDAKFDVELAPDTTLPSVLVLVLDFAFGVFCRSTMRALFSASLVRR